MTTTTTKSYSLDSWLKFVNLIIAVFNEREETHCLE